MIGRKPIESSQRSSRTFRPDADTSGRNADPNGTGSRLMRIARVAQRDGIDLIDVPRDERGKSFLRAVLDVFLQQNAVVQFQHLQVNAADQRKVTASGRKKLSSNHSNSSSTSPAKSVGVENPADCP